MILLTIFGLGMFLLGSLMVIKPLAFANGIAAFSQKPWFHPFEILSRLFIGSLFIVFAEKSPLPNLLYFLGIILCFVSAFLVLIGSKRHKRFALFTSTIGQWFRPLGLVSQLCGMVLIYLSLA